MFMFAKKITSTMLIFKKTYLMNARTFLIGKLALKSQLNCQLTNNFSCTTFISQQIARKLCRVLVLEAGDDESSNFLINIPGLVPFTQLTSLNWGYKTVPQKHACKAMQDNVGFLCSINLFLSVKFIFIQSKTFFCSYL